MRRSTGASFVHVRDSGGSRGDLQEMGGLVGVAAGTGRQRGRRGSVGRDSVGRGLGSGRGGSDGSAGVEFSGAGRGSGRGKAASACPAGIVGLFCWPWRVTCAGAGRREPWVAQCGGRARQTHSSQRASENSATSTSKKWTRAKKWAKAEERKRGGPKKLSGCPKGLSGYPKA